ncbi:hypothetical protein HMPREF3215_01760 [Staphylococcus simulans]|nr:hypothetical protein HMPREF3215_01760 [Staphylococcus simulans]
MRQFSDAQKFGMIETRNLMRRRAMQAIKENIVTIVAVAVAIIVGLILQYVYEFPLLVTAIIGILMGMLVGFILFIIQQNRDKHNKRK